MVGKFSVITTKELIAYMDAYKWRRKPSEMHTHHTWRPEHSTFKGKNHLQLMQGMERSQKARGFTEIGQHLTLFPDGSWGLCRDFNLDPASITGRNQLGFATEIIGNFDIGHDMLTGDQLESLLVMYSYMIHRFMRSNVKKAVVFHNQYAPKTCPGTGVSRAWLVGLVEGKLKGGDEEVEQIIVKIDGGKQGTVVKGFLKDGVTYVPVRDIAVACDMDIKWDGTAKTVAITKRGA